ncbi:hypothetical protein BHE74_00028492 [Ensete ventricosum]|nr:hypothetical protein BHE74_00028492 [Ensete ventricosum]
MMGARTRRSMSWLFEHIWHVRHADVPDIPYHPPRSRPDVVELIEASLKALVVGKCGDHKRPHAEKSCGYPSKTMRRHPDRPEPSYPRPPPPLLNSTRIKILLQIKEKGLLRMPNPLKGPRELRDQAKYYRFHRDYDHDMEDCHDLCNQIESSFIMGTSDTISGGPETHPCDHRDPLRSRLMSSLVARRPEEITHWDELLTHGSLWGNTPVKPMSPISPSRQEKLNMPTMMMHW